MDDSAAINELSNQWCILLTAQCCHALPISPNELSMKISNLAESQEEESVGKIILSGYSMSKTNEIDKISMMFDSLSTILYQFHSRPEFPRIFNKVFFITASVFSMNNANSEAKKVVKAIHTDDIDKAVPLNEFQVIESRVFILFSTMLSAASNLPQIKLHEFNHKIINTIFRYLNCTEPQSVRTAVGQILAVLSSVVINLKQIIYIFWVQFSKCKKEDEYRNFTTYLDGIANLQFGISYNEDFAELTLEFFNNFIDNEKKIDIGVVRLKFLSTFETIIININKNPDNYSLQYLSVLDSIWNIAVKWSSKGKHTLFCYTFLCHILLNSSSDFYINHSEKYFILLTKYAKNGQTDVLNLVLLILKNVPEFFKKEKQDELVKMISDKIIPLLFINNDNKIKLRFEYEDQYPIVLKIMNEIGKQCPEVLINEVFYILSNKEVTESNKLVRLIAIQSLAALCKEIPDKMKEYSNRMSHFFEEMLLAADPDFLHEQQHALPTFPTFHSDQQPQNEILSQIVFFLSVSGESYALEAQDSFRNFVEKVVQPDFCGNTPIIYINNIIQNIESATASDSYIFINYLRNVLKSYQINLSNCKDVQGYIYNFTNEWEEMRMNLDCLLLILLMSPDQKIINATEEVIEVLNTTEIIQFDEFCEYHKNNLATFLKETGTKDIIGNAKKMQDTYKEFTDVFLSKLFSKFEMRRKTISTQHSIKVIHYLTKFIQNDNEMFKKILVFLFGYFVEEANNQEIPQILSELDYSLTIPIGDALFEWLSTTFKGDYFHQTTTIMKTIVFRPEFKNLDKEDAHLQHLEKFVVMMLGYKDLRTETHFKNLEDSYSVYIKWCEEDPHEMKRLFNTKILVDTIYYSFFNILKSDNSQIMPKFFPYTLFLAITATFKHIELPREGYNKFCKYLNDFIEIHIHDDILQGKIVECLTELLKNNRHLLLEFSRQTYCSLFDIYSGSFLLSICNVFVLCSDFFSFYENSKVIIVYLLILHLSSSAVFTRKASHKLLSLVLNRWNSIFNKQPQRNLFIYNSVNNTSSYIGHSDMFIKYIIESIPSDICFDVISLLSNDMSLIKISHDTILCNISKVIPVVVRDCDIEHLISNILKLVCSCDFNHSMTAEHIANIFECVFNCIKTHDRCGAKYLCQLIIKFSCDHENNNKISECSVVALCSLFEVFPGDVSSYLVSIFDVYNCSVSDNIDNFVSYLSKSDITFIPSREEIIACNSLSQILLLISDFNIFDEYIKPHLSLLFFFGLFNYHRKDVKIGKFKPMLDILLETVLLRMNKSQSTREKTLSTLQNISVLAYATNTNVEFHIQSKNERKFILEDTELIKKLTNIFCDNNKEMKKEIFNIVFSNFFLSGKCERAKELLTMMISLRDEYNTNSIYIILLYTLHSLKIGRLDLVTTLVKNIQTRLMTCSDKSFMNECVPVLLTFLTYLQEGFDFHIIFNMMSVIPGICDRIIEHESCETISSEFCSFFDKYGSDLFIASLFVRFLVIQEDLNSHETELIINCLIHISNIYDIYNREKDKNKEKEKQNEEEEQEEKENEENWCLLLGVLVEYLRYKSCKSQKDYKVIFKGFNYNLDDFINFILSNFKSVKKLNFVIYFNISIYRQFHFVDISIDKHVVELISRFIKESKHFNKSVYSSLITFLNMIVISSDSETRVVASSLLYDLMNDKHIEFDESLLRYSKMNIKMNKKITDKISQTSNDNNNISNQNKIVSKSKSKRLIPFINRMSLDLSYQNKIDETSNQRRRSSVIEYYENNSNKRERVILKDSFPSVSLFDTGFTDDTNIDQILWQYVVDKAKSLQ
ncbi:hypothetical protein TVAG_165170 [Trichomonas vaginalis G3]|uniref:Uncharacterized protein n=1 Tax=Trichomonas vaginalis (strain ATCC PRA-98 / G3) TaxID=412133 RepID=A2DUJ8_TRIV3|nr:armadillo (ARM) repeat-containing protein family [Trichomonas vaginalis G3]EAY15889.1 hypothetical protein TVAG_165170 [Trichomonas vaginalis G3]KAI5506650.1 armadillo (ARM) repeat-containing protein family [Trichomonas vaginalis G3]|eukprot:XP_001328112.1 hypothetical protein [Trichomonas vaginalis G3]